MKRFGNILWGIVFILLGLIWGSNALGITDINLFFDGWWTLFIIVPCFIGLFKERSKTGNIIGLFVGIVLLLCCQRIIDFNTIWKLMIPAILVIIGLSFIFKDTVNRKINQEIKRLNEKQTNANVYCATFSEQNVRFDNQEFDGADLTAVFGSVKCDLTTAVITKDIVINASAIFGGIDIFVPNDVVVKTKSVPIFGGVSDRTVKSKNENAPIVYINAQSVFGGVEIK